MIGSIARILIAAVLICAVPVTAQQAAQVSDADLHETLSLLSREAASAYEQGDLSTTADKLEVMLPLLERQLGKSSGDYAAAAYDLAQILDELGRLQDAQIVHVLAVEATAAVMGPDSTKALSALNNQANNLANLGQLERAEIIFKDLIARRRAIAAQSGVPLANSIGNYASLLDSMGRHVEAEGLHREALQIKERELGLVDPDTLLHLGNLAVNLLAQGREEEAAAIQLSLLRRSDVSTDQPAADRATQLSNYAGTLDEQGLHNDAEPVHAEALEAAKESKHPLEIANALLNYGSNQASLGKLLQAQDFGTQAFRILEATLGGDHYTTLGAVNNLATLDLAVGNHHRAALGFSHIMRRLHEAGLKETRLGRSALGNLSVALLLNPEQSHLAHRPMGELVELTIKRRRGVDQASTSNAATTANELERWAIFALYAETQWALSEYENRSGRERPALAQNLAFRAMQEAMVGPASRAIATRAAEKFTATEPLAAGLADRRRELLAEAALVETNLSAELRREDTGDAARRLQMRSEIAVLKGELEDVDGQLRAATPEYFALLQPEPLSIAEAQALLGPDEAILLVVPGYFGSHAVAISRGDVLWFRPDWRIQQIDQAARKLLWNVGGNVQPSEGEFREWGQSNAVAFDRKTAHSLYEQLVAPAKPILSGKRHVYVAAAGALSHLPFSMLVAAEPVGSDSDPADLRETRWLADEYALVQLPSLQSLKFLRQHRDSVGAEDRRPFLGFGDPILEGEAKKRGMNRGSSAAVLSASDIFSGQQSPFAAPIADTEKLRAMARLPGTAVELQAMWEAFGKPADALFLGESATETRVKSTTISADVLVFATHGLLASDLGGIGEPGLVLTPPERASATEDGYLSSSEIAALEIDADWVILSACNTAAGDGSQGASGLSGIARAFFYAGAQTLLASHWPVDDDVAAKLTVRIMALLQQDASLSRAEAFQIAMREIRSDTSADEPNSSWAHPAAWAPFTLIGDGSRR